MPLDTATREALLDRVRFYRELGLTDFYARPLDPAKVAEWEAAGQAARQATEENPPVPAEDTTESRVLKGHDFSRADQAKPTGDVDECRVLKGHDFSRADQAQTSDRASAPEGSSAETSPFFAAPHATPPVPVSVSADDDLVPLDSYQNISPASPPSFFQEAEIPPRKPLPAPPAIAAAVPPAQRAAALQQIRDEIGDCTRCALHTGRNQLVFGDGDPLARLMFVGEGPGADEDAQGLPFVGKAGQLLNNMIAAMGLRRDQVYIANVVKCRPPGNRVPEPEEAATCTPFLFRQIDVIRPEVLVALGATAATWLLGLRQPLAGLRGRIHSYRGSKLIVTYHPAFLLRDPRQKKEAWADLQIAMRELGLKPPSKG